LKLVTSQSYENINVVTGARYAGLSYQVVSSRTTTNGEKYQTDAEGVLNNNGEAVVDVNVKKGRSYSVRIGALDNICYHNELSQYFNSPYDVNGTFTFKFAECAYSKLIIKNVNCQSGNDKIELFRQDQIGSLSNTGWVQYGCVNWETNGYSDVPMGIRFYKWEVTRNSLTETFYDTIYLNAGEYKTYEINY
jgi:hypothetical protein